MGLFTIFASKDVDEFANTLADDIAKRYSPAMDKSRSGKVSVDRLTRVLEGALDKAVEFQANHRLGLYRKARLMNTFKWRLKELGYTDEFTDVATEGLAVYITRTKAGAKKP